jgi:hypothetical protein
VDVNDEYVIRTEIARAIAVGIYRDIGAFVAVAKRDSPEDYARFKAEYQAMQAVQSSTPVKCRQSRNRSTILVETQKDLNNNLKNKKERVNNKKAKLAMQ